MNKTLEGNLRTIANCKDEGSILLRFKQVKDIVELIKENERLSILVGRCNCLTSDEYEATLDKLKEQSE